MAFICLLTIYKDDFYDPPHHPTLCYLRKNSTDPTIRRQCRRLLDRFLYENQSNPGKKTNKQTEMKYAIYFY